MQVMFQGTQPHNMRLEEGWIVIRHWKVGFFEEETYLNISFGPCICGDNYVKGLTPAVFRDCLTFLLKPKSVGIRVRNSDSLNAVSAPYVNVHIPVLDLGVDTRQALQNTFYTPHEDFGADVRETHRN